MKDVVHSTPLLLAACLAPMTALAAEPLRQTIDRHVAAAWKKNTIAPSKPASDAEFLRRVSLELTGVIPTHKQAVAFLDDSDPKKRLGQTGPALAGLVQVSRGRDCF